MIIKYLIGSILGGLVGYFVFYRLIGCSTGSCPITANPYISTVYGIILGSLIIGALATQSLKVADQPIDPEYKRITAEQAKARIDSGDEIIIVDVRTEDEYEVGHIANAILIPNETIGNEKPDLLLDLDKEILIYCRSGNRSAQAAKKLLAIGYTNVYDFGGIINWSYEIEQDKKIFADKYKEKSTGYDIKLL